MEKDILKHRIDGLQSLRIIVERPAFIHAVRDDPAWAQQKFLTIIDKVCEDYQTLLIEAKEV